MENIGETGTDKAYGNIGETGTDKAYRNIGETGTDKSYGKYRRDRSRQSIWKI